MYEEAFARMKRAAGVSEIDEVVHRYVGWWRRQLASLNEISANSRIHEITFFFTSITWN